MSDFIIKELRKRQEQIPYLYSPSNIEVYTPHSLVTCKLDKLPCWVWMTPTLKFLDPACKSGIYLSEIIIRLMDGLKTWEPDEHKRYDHIIKNMIVGYAYTTLGYKITKKLLYGDYNYNCDNIKLKRFDKESESDLTVEFDVIVGNPPYNAGGRENEQKEILWNLFVKNSLRVLNDGGFMCLVHPPGWRGLENELWPLITSKQIHYLEIHNSNDGKKMFGCGTRYDWYVMENTPSYKPSVIVDDEGQSYELCLHTFPFFPHNSVKKVFEIISKKAGDECNVIRCRGYDREKDWISDSKTKKHPHTVIDKILSEKKGGLIKTYSSRNDRGGFVSGVIISNNGKYCFNDFTGCYGIGKGVFKIGNVSSKEEGEEIVKAIQSKKFQKIVQSVLWEGWQTDYRFFKRLKKDFWKEFLNE